MPKWRTAHFSCELSKPRRPVALVPVGSSSRRPLTRGPPSCHSSPKANPATDQLSGEARFIHWMDCWEHLHRKLAGFFPNKKGLQRNRLQGPFCCSGLHPTSRPYYASDFDGFNLKIPLCDPTLSSVSALFSCAGGDSTFLSPRQSIHRHLVARRSAVVTCAQMAVPTAPAPWGELNVLGHRPWHHRVAVWKSTWHAGGGPGPRACLTTGMLD